MKINKKKILLFSMLFMFIFSLAGCGENNTVQKYIISNQSFSDKDALNKAAQPAQLAADQNIYASVHFIESPKGMEYTVKWTIDGKQVKTEAKKTVAEQQDVIVFSLDAKQAVKGTLKLEILYNNTLLSSKELIIQ